MTVSAQVPLIEYVGNGITVAFAYPFRILEPGHLKVFLDGVQQSSGFTVSGTDEPNGGNVTFAVAPVSGVEVLLARQVARDQLVDYLPFDAFPAETHERALDKLAMAAQEDAGLVNFYVRAPVIDVLRNLVLPFAAARANKFLAFDADGNAGATPGSAVGVVTHGDTLALGADDHLQYHTDARGDARYVTLAQKGTANGVPSLDALVKVPQSQLSPQPSSFYGGNIVATVAANALTIALKTWNGSDPSPTNPVAAVFRAPSSADSSMFQRVISAPLSIVIPQGMTFGHVSALDQHLFVYLIDNAGAVELAVSNLPPDYPSVARLRSLTTIATAPGATDPFAFFSTIPRSGVAWICVGKIVVNQPVAGQWTAAPILAEFAPFAIPRGAFRVYPSATQIVQTGTDTLILFNSKDYDFDGMYNIASSFYRPNVAGLYSIRAKHRFSESAVNSATIFSIRKNGSGAHSQILQRSSGVNDFGFVNADDVLMNGTSDILDLIINQNAGAPATLQAFPHATSFSGFRL